MENNFLTFVKILNPNDTYIKYIIILRNKGLIIKIV